jgi:uncharacterized membrane protein
MQSSIKATMLATAVASLFGCAGSTPPAAEPSGHAASGVKCQGVNECKGQSECASQSNHCAGHNECKGKGWVSIATGPDCTGRGGVVM